MLVLFATMIVGSAMCLCVGCFIKTPIGERAIDKIIEKLF